MITESLALFDLTPASQPVVPAPAVEVPCMWHHGRGPESTHRVVFAVDLMDSRWWRWGGIRPDGALQSAGFHRQPLFWVGAGHCTPCVDRDAGVGDRPGIVQHYTPMPRRSAQKETEQR
ncbi:hypothetical protein ABZ070_10165 [Streptomyces sp. NPDC006283]|uniref:hypothetical protein n=1 Tax=Streptomyces sp. NPDC006283 TaxID=3156741 RepID=UPI0033A7084F